MLWNGYARYFYLGPLTKFDDLEKKFQAFDLLKYNVTLFL